MITEQNGMKKSRIQIEQNSREIEWANQGSETVENGSIRRPKRVDVQVPLSKNFTLRGFICLDSEPNPIAFQLSKSDRASGRFLLCMPYSYPRVLELKTPRGTSLSFCGQVFPP